MSNNPRKTKGGDHKLNISLNEEQKLAKAEILANKVTILKGPAGCGKTQLAVAVALDQLLKKEINKIVITRPVVTTGEELGFLPGGVADKLFPYLLPIYECMYNCLDKQLIDSYLADGTIQIMPLAYLRGITFLNSFVIADEVQNITNKTMEDVLTRLGLGSKLILCGDMSQCDLKDKKLSGFPFLKNLEKVSGFKFIELKANHRDPLVEEILKIYSDFRS